MKNIRTTYKDLGLISLMASLLFIPFLGNVHLFDWDEINFAECAREMIVTGDYFKVQLNFQAFWEKPPLFFWLQVISMKMFGINEFAARFPNAICGIITLNVLYLIGKKIYNRKFALLWVLVYSGTFLPHFYFKTGIIDPWFNLFIFLAIYFAIEHTKEKLKVDGYKTAALSGLFIGLAVLTKGPAGLLIFGLSVFVFLIWKKFKFLSSFKYLLTFFVAMLIGGFSWFLILIISGHQDVVNEFIVYQIRLFNTKDSGHGGFLFYHFVILLIGCFPSSVFFILSHKPTNTDTEFQKHVKLWMQILFWVVLILFTVVQTKIVHYSSMCWLPLSFLATYSINKFLQYEFVLRKRTMTLFFLIAILLGLAFTLVPLIDKFKSYLLQPGLVNDEFAVENIKSHVEWLGFEWIIGVLFVAAVFYFVFLIRRKPQHGLIGLYVSCLLTVNLLAILIVPKVEKYSQAAAIDFYKSISGKDCYVETFGYKSYAYLFYTNKPKEMNTPQLLEYVKMRSAMDLKTGENDPNLMFNFYSMNWMMTQKIDKPVYIVAKITSEKSMLEYAKDIKLMFRKNGYSFYERLPQ